LILYHLHLVKKNSVVAPQNFVLFLNLISEKNSNSKTPRNIYLRDFPKKLSFMVTTVETTPSCSVKIAYNLLPKFAALFYYDYTKKVSKLVLVYEVAKILGIIHLSLGVRNSL